MKVYNMETVPLRNPLSMAIVHGLITADGLMCYKNHYLYKYSDKELAQITMIFRSWNFLKDPGHNKIWYSLR